MTDNIWNSSHNCMTTNFWRGTLNNSMNSEPLTKETLERAIKQLLEESETEDVRTYADLLRDELAAMKTAYILRRSLFLQEHDPPAMI